MPPTRKKISIGKKVLLFLLFFFLLVAIAFHIFMTRYLPPLIRQRMEDVVVRGSDSLYRFEMGKIDLSFWGGSFKCQDLRIFVDSNRYQQLKELKRLPALTFEIQLPKGEISGIGLRSLLFRKKLEINLIDFKSAAVSLSRHFRTTENNSDQPDQPLWKLVQPALKSIAVRTIVFRNVAIRFQNADSATAFGWQLDSCYAAISSVLVDSSSAKDTSRMLYSKDIAITAKDVKMKMPDGLYRLEAKALFFASSLNKVEVDHVSFKQEVDNAAFIKHFGYQHEIYGLSATRLRLVNFDLPRWILFNELNIDTIAMQDPDINVYLDRNPPPNPNSKLGQYPHQLIQKAPLLIRVKRLTVTGGTFTYREKNRKSQLTAKMIYQGIRGTIDNITNDSLLIEKSPNCVVDVNSQLMQTGIVHAIFRFHLADRSGGFDLSAAIANLDAPQLQTLIKATASADLQSMNMHQLNFRMSANERSGTGSLTMKYDNMDLLINEVNDDGSFDKKGLLSFLVNHLVIYQENPSKNGDERVANNVQASRVVTKSFFNFIWKTLYTAAGKIILRPVAQRKIEKRKLRKKP